MIRIYSEQNKHTFLNLLGEINWDMELRLKTSRQCCLLTEKLLLRIINLSSLKDCLEKEPKTNHGLLLGLKKV